MNLHTHLQKKKSTLKHLLSKERKKERKEKRKKENACQQANEINPKPTRNATFAKFSTIRLAEMSVSRWRKKIFFRKRCFYEHGFRSAGFFKWMYDISIYILCKHICEIHF